MPNHRNSNPKKSRSTSLSTIGGDTTGTTIAANGITWELDLGPDAIMRKAVKKLDGRTVLVRGSLRKQSGVETKDRWIVTVQGFQAADDAETAFGDGPDVSIATSRADTRFLLVSSRGGITMDITSRSGIGKASSGGRIVGPRPSVRLHLRGLESFKASNTSFTVEAAVASTGEHLKRVNVRMEGQEVSVSNDSPYWTDIQIVGSQAAIPLRSGYFEIKLPAKLFEDNPREITLSWIDFFRG